MLYTITILLLCITIGAYAALRTYQGRITHTPTMGEPTLYTPSRPYDQDRELVLNTKRGFLTADGHMFQGGSHWCAHCDQHISTISTPCMGKE